MCGIAGILDRSNSPTEVEVSKMVSAVAHRGPDDQGVVVAGAAALGHRRLAVIDTSQAGHQPMSTSDGRYTISYNGEIYNYQELADKYLSDVKLDSSSDTEVLLQLLVKRGDSVLSELRGMFALALWDKEKEELLLARDFFGKKPLFWFERGDRFIFASEPKAILAVADVGELDQGALAQYLLAEYPPAPGTPWQNIRQLPAGSALRIGATERKQWTFWQPSFEPKLRGDDAKLMQELDELLAQAVQRRLVADVPVGLFLSGGLDSSTIGWYLQQQVGDRLKSFSVGFVDEEFDESHHAAEVAAALGLDHKQQVFSVDDFKPTLAELAALQDMPLADASLLPTYVLSKMARRDVTVVLDGDGSDELLGGYGTFKAAEAAEKIPPVLSPLVRQLAEMLPTKFGDFTFDFKAKSFVRGLEYEAARRNAVWLGAFSPPEIRRLLSDSADLSQLFATVDGLEHDANNLTDTISAHTIAGYLHNDILVKLDRATMYVGLEARTPFLDSDLAEFLMKLPPQYKQDKLILRRLMKGRLPEQIVERQKKGFGIPLAKWLAGPLHGWAAEVLAADNLSQHGLFNEAEVQRLLSEHKDKRHDHRKKLWTLLCWQLWYQRWAKGSPSDRSTPARGQIG